MDALGDPVASTTAFDGVVDLRSLRVNQLLRRDRHD
jgi:hypothetical protein